MKSIDAAEFGERCLILLDQLDDDGPVIVKDGKPIARLLRYEPRHAELIGSLSHKVKVRRNIFGTGVELDDSAEA